MYTYVTVPTSLHDFDYLSELVHVFPTGKEPLQHEDPEVLVHVTVQPSHHLHTHTMFHIGMIHKRTYITKVANSVCVTFITMEYNHQSISQRSLLTNYNNWIAGFICKHTHTNTDTSMYVCTILYYLSKLRGEFEGGALEAEVVPR